MSANETQISADTFIDNDAVKLTSYQINQLRMIASHDGFRGLIEPNLNKSRESSGPIIVKWWRYHQIQTVVIGKYRTISTPVDDQLRLKASARLRSACMNLVQEDGHSFDGALENYLLARKNSSTETFFAAVRLAEVAIVEANQIQALGRLNLEEREKDGE
jgi:hypothetical protein